jgi:hypothetical protein
MVSRLHPIKVKGALRSRSVPPLAGLEDHFPQTSSVAILQKLSPYFNNSARLSSRNTARYTLLNRVVSEFMSQKLDRITLRGMMNEG